MVYFVTAGGNGKCFLGEGCQMGTGGVEFRSTSEKQRL